MKRKANKIYSIHHYQLIMILKPNQFMDLKHLYQDEKHPLLLMIHQVKYYLNTQQQIHILFWNSVKVRKRTYSRSISQPQPEKQSTLSINTINSLKSITEEKNGSAEEEQQKKSLLSRMAEIFDLDLLKDPIFLNLMIGMSLAVYAEINFSLLTPFILSDYHFETFQIASIMSTLATADIVFRFCAPFIANWLKFSPKLMYTISLGMLITSRTGKRYLLVFIFLFFFFWKLYFISGLIFANSYNEVIVVAIVLGIAKGFRTVFMSLLIPSYVPIEKLASASGMQMVANGLFNMIGGPILGIFLLHVLHLIGGNAFF